MGLGLTFLFGVTALAQSLGLAPMALPLATLDARLPVVFRLHMAASGLALFSIALTAVLRRRPQLHRPLGRATAALVLVGALTALPSALVSEAGPAVRAGLLAQALVWLALILAGLVAIRAGRTERHAAAMLLMASVASGAVVSRLALAAIAALRLPLDQGYAVVAWLAWCVPLAGTAALLAARRPSSRNRR